MQIAEFCFGLSAAGLETGSGRAGLLIHPAGPVFFCSVTGRAGPKFFGPGLIFLARAGL